MSGTSSNDNGRPPVPAQKPDAHGQAALLLVESLIHSLIADSVISVARAVEIVDVAMDVKRDGAAERGEVDMTAQRAVVLLEAISDSLKLDLPRD